MCCMDYSLGGHFGHVTNNTACNGGRYVDSRTSLFSNLYPWFSSGIFSKMVAFSMGIVLLQFGYLFYNTYNRCNVKSCCLNNWIRNMTWSSKLNISILHLVHLIQEHAYICHLIFYHVYIMTAFGNSLEVNVYIFCMQQLVIYIFSPEVPALSKIKPTLHVAMKWCITSYVHYSSHYEVAT